MEINLDRVKGLSIGFVNSLVDYVKSNECISKDKIEYHQFLMKPKYNSKCTDLLNEYDNYRNDFGMIKVLSETINGVKFEYAFSEKGKSHVIHKSSKYKYFLIEKDVTFTFAVTGLSSREQIDELDIIKFDGTIQVGEVDFKKEGNGIPNLSLIKSWQSHDVVYLYI